MESKIHASIYKDDVAFQMVPLTHVGVVFQ